MALGKASRRILSLLEVEEAYKKGHLPSSLKQQIREKAEDVCARKFSAHGSKSLLWISAKAVSQNLRAEEIEQLPEYISAIVRASSNYTFSVAPTPRLSFFARYKIINPPLPEFMDLELQRGITIRV